MFTIDNINSFDPSEVKDEAFIKAWNHYQEVIKSNKKRNFNKASPKQKVKQVRKFIEYTKFNDPKIWKRKGLTGYQYACVETHRARYGTDPQLKVIYNWS